MSSIWARWVCLGPGVCTCVRQIPGAGPLALLTIPLVLLAHEKCRACPLKITVMFISNTSNRLIRGRRVKGEGARNLCLVACVRLGGIPIFLVNMVAFASGANFQTAGSMADCAGALDPISDRRRWDGWAWEASIIMIRPSSSLIRASILSVYHNPLTSSP